MRLALFLLLTLTLVAGSPKWRKITSTPSEDFHAADERTERRGSVVLRWERKTFRASEDGRKAQRRQAAYLTSNGVREADAGRYTHTTTFREYDCENARVRYVDFFYHRDDGLIIFKEPREKLRESWESPAPESANESLMLDACRKPAEMY